MFIKMTHIRFQIRQQKNLSNVNFFWDIKVTGFAHDFTKKVIIFYS